MSSIDSYHHQRLGWIRCPVEKPPRGYGCVCEIAIYRLLEDTEQLDIFRGKKGDLFVGGGNGEWGFFRLSSPAGVRFVLDLDVAFDGDRKQLYESVWDWPIAYALCCGFEKEGWRYDEDIETWLAERVAGFVVSNYPHFFPGIDPTIVPQDWRSIARPDFKEEWKTTEPNQCV